MSIRETGRTTVKQFWHKGKAVAEVPSDGEMRMTLLNLDGGSPLVLLESAVIIWDLIDGTRTEAEILMELNRVFSGADERAMEGHLRTFLAKLSQHGLAATSTTPDPRRQGT